MDATSNEFGLIAFWATPTPQNNRHNPAVPHAVRNKRRTRAMLSKDRRDDNGPAVSRRLGLQA